MTWKTFPTKYLHIELSTHCNAACPLCIRYYAHTDIVRPDMPLVSISLETFKKYFSVDFIKNLNKILYCGTRGDPIMAKDCYEIIEYVYSLNPECEQILHTNGGIRTENFWSKMGELSNKSKTKLRVTFSIDGLADTNHLYRRNIDWERLMRNVKAYMANGGYGVWEMLLFKHNEHQEEEARHLARKEFGMQEFRAKRPAGFDDFSSSTGGTFPIAVYNSRGEFEYKLYPADKTDGHLPFRDHNFENLDTEEIDNAKIVKFFPKTKKMVEEFKHEETANMQGYDDALSQREIKCLSLSYNANSEVYVSAEGILHPCCFVGTRYDSNIDFYTDYQIKHVIESRRSELDLNLKNVDEIIQSGILDELYGESWKKGHIKHGKLAICAETCGENSWHKKLYQ
jgi:hypothetical protein